MNTHRTFTRACDAVDVARAFNAVARRVADVRVDASRGNGRKNGRGAIFARDF